MTATGAIAQVKAEAKPIGRPALQSLYGIAQVEKATPLFFALAGWTPEAEAWAERAGLALFGFSRDGIVEPNNGAARRLFAGADLQEPSVNPRAKGMPAQRLGGAHRRNVYAGTFGEPGEGQTLPIPVEAGEAVVAGPWCYWAKDHRVWRSTLSAGAAELPTSHSFPGTEYLEVSAVADDQVFALFWDYQVGGITALQNDLSAARWEVKIPDGFPMKAAHVGDAVLVAGRRWREREKDLVTTVWCLASSTGRIRWQTDLQRYDYPRYLAASTDVVLVAGHAEDAKTDSPYKWNSQAAPFGYLAALDAGSGRSLWTIDDVGVEEVAISGDVVVAALAEPDPFWRGYRAFNADTGQRLWEVTRLPDDRSGLPLPPFCVGDGHVWLAEGKVRCRDLHGGAAVWETNLDPFKMLWMDGLLWIDEGGLFAVDAVTGVIVDGPFDVPSTWFLLWADEGRLGFAAFREGLGVLHARAHPLGQEEDGPNWDEEPELREQHALALFSKGTRFATLGRSAEAVELFDQVVVGIGESPEPELRELFARALFSKGFMFSVLGLWDAELATYDRLADRFGESPEQAVRELVARGLFNKGIRFAELGRSQDAVEVYGQIVARFGDAKESEPELRDHVAAAMLSKGVGFTEIGLFEDAIAVYDQIATRFCDARGYVIKALFNKSLQLAELGRLEDAVAASDQLVVRFGDASEPALRELLAQAMVNKGVSLGRLGWPHAEIEAYEQVVARFGDADELALRTQVAWALRNKGATFGELGRREEEIEAYDEVVARFGDADEPGMRGEVAKALFNKGRRLGDLGRPEDEIELYDHAIERVGDSTEPALRHVVVISLFNKAVTLGPLGRSAEAVETYDEIIERFGDDPEPGIIEWVAKAMILRSRP